MLLSIGTVSALTDETTEELNSNLDTNLDSGELEDNHQDSSPVEFEKYILMIDRERYQPSQLRDVGADIRYEYSIIDGVAVEVPVHAEASLENLDFVESVEPDLVTSLPTLDGSSSEGSGESYDGGDGLVISVLDTGIDDSHLDLQGQVVDHRDFTGSGPEDRHGHGTHVAGIASGTGEADSRYTGVAPETGLMNVKVLNDDGSGRVSDAIQGIDYSVENNADVIVMSLGVQTECDGSDPLSQAADNAVEQGVPTIVSAGNEGPDSQTITAPGCGHQVFTVGASGSDSVASFSSRGATDDGRIKPNLVAPGVNIFAAEAGTESDYVSKSGTSMSAPYVAGAVALLANENESDPDEYFDVLSRTAYSLDEDENSQGSGQINISAALIEHSEETHSDGDDAGEEDSVADEDEGRESAEEQDGIKDVDEGHETVVRDGKEYYLYEGETDSGRKADIFVDKETGEVEVVTNWSRTINCWYQRLIEAISNFF